LEDRAVRILTGVLTCLTAGLIASGCYLPEKQPVVKLPKAEIVALDFKVQQKLAEIPGAKRVLLCWFNDDRDVAKYVTTDTGLKRPRKPSEPILIGENFYPAAGKRVNFVSRENICRTVPSMFGEYLKKVGFNVAFAEGPAVVQGAEQIRALAEKNKADYVITGNLIEFMVRGHEDVTEPVWAMVKFRLGIYTDKGELRTYFPAQVSRGEFLGEAQRDPMQVAKFLDGCVHQVFPMILEDEFFAKALDLKSDAVREMLEGEGAAPTRTEETKPAEKKTEEKKTEEKKTEEKKTEEKKTEEKKTETKPAETKKPEETKPAEKK
jgi:hypothetical protein